MVQNTSLYLHEGRKLIRAKLFMLFLLFWRTSWKDLEAVHKEISDSMDKACFVGTDTDFRNA